MNTNCNAWMCAIVGGVLAFGVACPLQAQQAPEGFPTPSGAPAAAVPGSAATGNSGGELLLEAHNLTRQAESIADYTAILNLCQQAIRAGVSDESAKYSKRLMGWAYNRRGELLAGQGHDTVALADFESSVHNDPTRWRALNNRGINYAMLGRHDSAIADFSRTIELNPTYANAWFNRAEVRYEMGNYEEAVDDYSRAIQLEPNDSTFYNSRGHAYYRMRMLREAAQDYTVSVRVDPKNASALTNRGDLYAELGYYDRAVRDYQDAVRFDPELRRAYQSAAWLMATCPEETWRSGEGALEAAARAVEANSKTDHRYLDTLAAAQANAGDYSQAQKTLKAAIQLAPAEVADHYRARLALYSEHKPYRSSPRAVPELAASKDDDQVQQVNNETPVRPQKTEATLNMANRAIPGGH